MLCLSMISNTDCELTVCTGRETTLTSEGSGLVRSLPAFQALMRSLPISSTNGLPTVVEPPEWLNKSESEWPDASKRPQIQNLQR